MAFNIDDYFPTRDANTGAPPADIKDGLATIMYASTTLFPQLSAGVIFSQNIAEDIAHIIMYRRPNCYYNCKKSGTRPDFNARDMFAPVVMHYPNIFAEYNTFETRTAAEIATAKDNTATTASGTTVTSGSNKADTTGSSTGNGTTEEKYNPVQTPFSKLSGKTQTDSTGSDETHTTGSSNANGTTRSQGNSTTEHKAANDELIKRLSDVRNPLLPIVDAIISACVYTAEELEEAYYMDNADECGV